MAISAAAAAGASEAGGKILSDTTEISETLRQGEARRVESHSQSVQDEVSRANQTHSHTTQANISSLDNIT